MSFNSPELVRASQQGDLAAVRRLVESGADVNSVGDHGIGPLLTFTPAVMEYLLSQGADPNRQTNESGDPVLLGIAYFNNVACVRLLLELAKTTAEPACSIVFSTAWSFVTLGCWRSSRQRTTTSSA